MASQLTAAELRHYHERGFLPARPAFTATEVTHYRGRIRRRRARAFNAKSYARFLSAHGSTCTEGEVLEA
jgi:hypothetical protein